MASWFDLVRRRSSGPMLPGRSAPIPTSSRHAVFGVDLQSAPAGPVWSFGMGCFWGAERKLWSLPGVSLTAVGYQGGATANPTYEEVCSGRTGHAEVVRVVHDPSILSDAALLAVFWEGHDPTQGDRQGNDVGTQYRSAIYWTTEDQRVAAERSRDAYGQALARAGHRRLITTEIAPAGPFYFAEDYHQQYLSKNPGGYCGHGGTGVSCPIGVDCRG